jgi:hypothetical protein
MGEKRRRDSSASGMMCMSPFMFFNCVEVWLI